MVIISSLQSPNQSESPEKSRIFFDVIWLFILQKSVQDIFGCVFKGILAYFACGIAVGLFGAFPSLCVNCAK